MLSNRTSSRILYQLQTVPKEKRVLLHDHPFIDIPMLRSTLFSGVILRCPYFLLGTLYNISQLKCSQPTWLSQNSSVYKLPSCARIFNYSGCARLPSSNMSLPCSSKHKKPVCDKCTAGTNCTKCCLCQPHSRGRPRKDSVSSDSETLARSNPERQARIHHDTVASASSAVDIVV